MQGEVGLPLKTQDVESCGKCVAVQTGGFAGLPLSALATEGSPGTKLTATTSGADCPRGRTPDTAPSPANSTHLATNANHLPKLAPPDNLLHSSPPARLR